MRQSHDDEWETAGTDPNNTDLGYDLRQLTVTRFGVGGKRYMMLPREEEPLDSDEFIVATADSLSELADCR